MKKYFYIGSFVLLGAILQFLAHATVEIWYIGLLLKDFGVYSFGLSWRAWFVIHHVGTVILLAGGTIFGFWQGKFWWVKLYNKDGVRTKK